ncbi:MAG: tRNA pseudouridine(13) synthase TruD [Anaerolineae bacterium]|nr:tRNA pseudouridine(13) synthase TruD [Anaerolineae bacterium]
MNSIYLTADQVGIGGQIKAAPEDFFVEEMPLYAPSGQGQHIYAKIEKIGLSTPAAARKIAQALGISPRVIGYAGLKDAQAVTRQTFSIDNVSVEAVQALDIPNVTILDVNRHRNKLKTGHLTGNRFEIRVTQVDENAVSQAKAIVDVLARKGVPNFFDSQRFGNRGNTGQLGQLIVQNNVSEFVAEFLGRPHPHEAVTIQAARQRVDEGDWAGALNIWPNNFSDERQVLEAIHKANGDVSMALNVLNKKTKTFFVSAFQAHLFNRMLIDRVQQLDQLEDGDIAYIHQKGAAFVVESAAVEQPRADSFEISPAGPIFGTKTLEAQGKPGQREKALLEEYLLSLEAFKVPGLKISGARRPYRFPVKNPEVWWDRGLMIAFELPSGSYATRVLAEVMKTN